MTTLPIDAAGSAALDRWEVKRIGTARRSSLADNGFEPPTNREKALRPHYSARDDIHATAALD